MARRGLALIWVVSTIVLSLAGCRHDPAAKGDAPRPGGALVAVAALPLQAALAKTAGARFEYARTPGIARKLDASRADVVIADSATIDRLVAAGKLDAATRRGLAVDRLVIVAQPGSPVPLAKPEDLAKLDADAPPWRGRLAVLDPESWPEGALTRAALASMHVQDAIRDRMQTMVGTDELARAVEDHKRMLGVVGNSTATALGGRVQVLANLGPAVAYQAAVARSSAHRDAAARFIEALASSASLFEKRGFQRSTGGR